MLLKCVDDAGLPGVNFFMDGAVVEVEFDGDLAEHGEPCEFSRLFKRFEPGGVARLQGLDLRRDRESSHMEGRPEET